MTALLGMAIIMNALNVLSHAIKTLEENKYVMMFANYVLLTINHVMNVLKVRKRIRPILVTLNVILNKHIV